MLKDPLFMTIFCYFLSLFLFFRLCWKKTGKHGKVPKKMILTSKGHAEHPFAGRNTQQMLFTFRLHLIKDRNCYNTCLFTIVFCSLILMYLKSHKLRRSQMSKHFHAKRIVLKYLSMRVSLPYLSSFLLCVESFMMNNLYFCHTEGKGRCH